MIFKPDDKEKVRFVSSGYQVVNNEIHIEHLQKSPDFQMVLKVAKLTADELTLRLYLYVKTKDHVIQDDIVEWLFEKVVAIPL